MKNVFLLSCLLAGSATYAEVPRVVADIAPVHGLVSQVMKGAGSPDLVVPPGASPHGYAMRPSEARALSEAKVVFWVGGNLSPWLEAPIETLADGAIHVTLADVPGLITLTYRTGARFEAHDHAHDGEAQHSGHDHDAEHDDHKHDHGHEHEEKHDHAKDEHADENHAHDHDADSIDGHMWLNPENAMLWIDAIATTLAEIDPGNAQLYAGNAAAAKSEISALSDRIEAQLKPLVSTPFIVFHDSYHYFEDRFGVTAAGSITLADDGGASAARLSEVREVIAKTGATCVLVEPRSNKGLVDAVAQDSDLKITSLDAVGVDIPLGSDYYPALLRQISDGLAECLK